MVLDQIYLQITSPLKRLAQVSLYTSLLLFLLSSCNDPTSVGAGIVDTEIIDIQTGEFNVVLSQEDENPFVTYVAGGGLEENEAQCGSIEDDVFGKTSAGFYMQFTPLTQLVGENPLRIVDSVILVLYLDSLSSYGELNTLTFSIDRLAETIEGGSSYLSNQKFDIAEELISGVEAEADFSIPEDDEVDQAAHIKVRLPNSMGTELFDLDSAALNNDGEFIKNYFGIYVRPSGENNMLLGFRPYRSSNQTILSGIRILYRESPSDTTQLTFNLVSTLGYSRTPVINTYEHDYTGSRLELKLEDPESDSLIYVQGLGGVRASMNIDGLSSLGDILVNKAEFFVPIQPESIYADKPPMRTLYLTRENLAGIQEFIPEFTEATAFNFTPMGRLDTLEDGRVGYAYNIPIQTKELVDGTIINEEIRLQNVPPPTDPTSRSVFGPVNLREASQRSVIFNPQPSEESIRLRITYTSN